MKTSIRKQFAGIYIGLMAGTILLCWFVNNTLLETFYVSNKVKVIQSAYDKINKTVDGGVSRDTQQELTDICTRYNIALLIGSDSFLIYASPNVNAEDERVRMERRMYGYIFNLFEEQPNNPNRIREETASFNRTKTYEYVEMAGTTDNGCTYIMRTPMESIQESVDIANRLLAYVGSFMVLISGIVIWLVSRKVTEPILELARISERMTHLDFEAKYESESQNEIALLGDNINKLSESLEKTISELKTANNELMKDIEKKERIEEMRKEFLSNVSHELKTPIALIQGYAEGLQEGIDESLESRAFYCEVIVDEAAKMNRMVQKLLTLNQLEFGNDVVAMERFDIVSLIRGYLQSVDLLAKQNGIEVRMGESCPIYVWADEYKVEEVFKNYFTNAMNHCAGKKVIDISLRRVTENIAADRPLPTVHGRFAEAPSGERALPTDSDRFVETPSMDQALITGQELPEEKTTSTEEAFSPDKVPVAEKVRIGVFNTGEPIPEESLAYIWDKFYKVDRARTREYGGNGIGLSIVKAIMDSLHRSYGVENYTNGVLFWFELETVREGQTNREENNR